MTDQNRYGQLEIDGLSRAEFLELHGAIGDEVEERPRPDDGSVYHELGTATVVLALTAASLALLRDVLARSESRRVVRVCYRRATPAEVEELEISFRDEQSRVERNKTLDRLVETIRRTSGLPEEP